MLTCHEITLLAGDFLERKLEWRRRLGVLLHLMM